MDKEQLSQLRHLKKEIEIIENQMDGLKISVVTDSVRGSSPNFPYAAHKINITGADYQTYENRLDRLRKRIGKKRVELISLVEEITEYIDTVEDSLIRQIIILRYVNGLTWEGVAEKIGGNNTADSVRMLHNRFLKIC